jgi:glucose-1-phosphate adenylyltransferase
VIKSGRVYAEEFGNETANPSYWRDIGTIDCYHQACMDLGPWNPPHSLHAFGLASRAASTYGAEVNRGARVCRSMLCGSVRVDDGADIEESVLMPGVHVGPGATLRRAIVDEGITIPRDFIVGQDPHYDRTRHLVTQGGVVVISRPATAPGALSSPGPAEKPQVSSAATVGAEALQNYRMP